MNDTRTVDRAYFETFCSHFDVRRWGHGGNTAHAICLTHEDQQPSLDIDLKNGQILMTCRAGCANEDILAAAGMTFADFWPPSDESLPKSSRNGGGWGDVVADYLYPDETGALLYRVRRFESKDFLPQHMNGSNQWKNGYGDRRVPFGLDRLAALPPGSTVHYSEGEKDALNLQAAGFEVTTHPGGVNGYRDEYAHYLAGFNLVIWAHNDDAGRIMADRVARSAHPVTASVKVIHFEGNPKGYDVSDYLAEGHTRADLLALVEPSPFFDPKASETLTPDPQGVPYRIKGGRLYRRVSTGEGITWRPLSNFEAEIQRDELRDDGAHTARVYAVSGRGADGRAFPTVDVLASEFGRMAWIAEKWGARAIIEAENRATDYTRAAVQHLSKPVEGTVFAHPGWRNLPGHGWCYLSADQVLSASGPVDGVVVKLERVAASIALPEPPATDEERAGVVRMITERFLALGPDRLTVPLLAATIRAALCELAPADFSLWLTGPSGAFKTEMAAVCARFYGPAFDRLNLQSWTSTANALERSAFDHKDALFVPDDYAPQAGTRAQSELRDKAERVIRGAGNRSGRGRLGRDGRPLPVYEPRGLALVTGEDVPGGHSRTARIVVLEVSRGDISSRALSELQTAEGRALPSRAMSAFIQDLAGRFDDERNAFADRVKGYRDKLTTDEAHARTPDALAQLTSAWWLWIDFGKRCGAFDQVTAADLLQRASDALLQTVTDQVAQVAAEDAALRFMSALWAGFRSGAFHANDAVSPEGPPKNLGAWGWRTRESIQRRSDGHDGTTYEEQPGGPLVGYVNESAGELWIIPESTIQAVRRFDPEAALHTDRTTGRYLDAASVLIREPSRETLKSRRSIGGRQVQFWVLKVDLNGDDDAESM